MLFCNVAQAVKLKKKNGHRLVSAAGVTSQKSIKNCFDIFYNNLYLTQIYEKSFCQLFITDFRRRYV